MTIGQHSFQLWLCAVAFTVASLPVTGAVNRGMILARGLSQTCLEETSVMHADASLESVMTVFYDSYEQACDIEQGTPSDMCYMEINDEEMTVSVVIDMCSIDATDAKDACFEQGGQFCSSNTYVSITEDYGAAGEDFTTEVSATCTPTCVSTSCNMEDLSKQAEEQGIAELAAYNIPAENAVVNSWGECVDSKGQSTSFGTPLSP